MAWACFTFDNLGEAAEIGEGTRVGVDPAGHPSITTGLPAVLALLAAHDVRSTFFVEGWNGEHHPDVVRDVAARGHEVGMHGWVHEPWASLTADDERRLAGRATDALAAALGVAPVGFRAPGGATTFETERILAELGYRFDASLDPGGGRRLMRLPGGLPCVPFVWPAVDGFWYLRPEPEAANIVRDEWLRRLDRIAAEPEGIFLLVCHPFVTGVEPERLAGLAAVIEQAVADPRVEVATVGGVADHVR